MAQSTFCPGFSTIIGNLIQSYAPPNEPIEYRKFVAMTTM